ncbi:unnamed protein product [Amoebophrya sp. A120]|nr:unnamed protein product [Amoebophrya sp. A120]|eukprot:GSA120T00008061001.1
MVIVRPGGVLVGVLAASSSTSPFPFSDGGTSSSAAASTSSSAISTAAGALATSIIPAILSSSLVLLPSINMIPGVSATENPPPPPNQPPQYAYDTMHTPRRRGERVKWIELVHHTFRDGNITDNGLALWSLESCAIPMADQIQLFTDVTERSGQLWNREAITTDNWEVQFQLDVSALNIIPKTRNVGVAFWLTDFQVTSVLNAKNIVGSSPMNQADSDWNDNLAHLGYDFLGHDTTLRGFGLIFSIEDETGNVNPNLSCTRTPRSEKLQMGVNFPDKNAMKIDFRNQPLDVRVRVKAGSVSVDYKFAATGTSAASDRNAHYWRHVCMLRDYEPPKRTYMGWSAWSGTPKVAGQAPGDFRAAVKKIRTWNYNLATVGSEMSGVAEEIRDMYADLHKKNFLFENQREQTEAINGILGMLKQYVMGSHKTEESQARTLLHVKSQMLDMEASALKLKNEIHYVLDEGEKRRIEMSAAEKKAKKDRILRELRQEMGSIKNVISSSAEDTQKLATVSTSAQEAAKTDKKVMSVSEQTDAIKRAAESQMFYTSWMNGMVIVSLLGIVVCIFSKIIYYEKKHLL